MFTRTALTGLLVAAATAIFPAFAGATIAPTLALEQSATAAGSSSATGLNINFNSIVDSDKSLTIGFPAGFLLNLDMNGGSCVASGAPSPLCVLGSGTIDAASATPKPITLYLVAPPSLADVAGVALVEQGGTTYTGALTLASTPPIALSLSLSFTPAPGPTELQFTLASTRLPTSCSPTPSVAVHATSWGKHPHPRARRSPSAGAVRCPTPRRSRRRSRMRETRAPK